MEKKFLINDFEGPLDLLLHLLKTSKMDIYDIKIVEITNQYIDYISQMKEMSLDIASEYLVMAAELIEMKSKYLINKKDEEEVAEPRDEEEELKRRLLEYKKYKESLNTFKELEDKRNNYYTRIPETLSNITDKKIENDGSISIFDLLDALNNILKRQEYNKPIATKITSKELSVKDKVIEIRNILKSKKKVNFTSLFEEVTRPYIVVTFLSILEMSKNREIVIKQGKNFDEIIVERVE